MIISIEIFPDNIHKDFDNIEDLENWIDENELDWLDCKTKYFMNEFYFAQEHGIEATTLPVDETRDLHLFINFEDLE
jgi:hypothetical protein